MGGQWVAGSTTAASTVDMDIRARTFELHSRRRECCARHIHAHGEKGDSHRCIAQHVRVCFGAARSIGATCPASSISTSTTSTTSTTSSTSISTSTSTSATDSRSNYSCGDSRRGKAANDAAAATGRSTSTGQYRKQLQTAPRSITIGRRGSRGSRCSSRCGSRCGNSSRKQRQRQRQAAVPGPAPAPAPAPAPPSTSTAISHAVARSTQQQQ